MKPFIQFIARWKLRYDYGNSFYKVFLLLLIAVGPDWIAAWTHLPAKVTSPLIAVGVLVLVTPGGYMMDKLGLIHAITAEQMLRNKMLTDALESKPEIKGP